MKHWCFIFWCFVCCTSLFAQEDETEELIIASDRPGLTYTATTVPKGYLLLEVGLGLDLMDSVDQWGVNVTDIRYGLAKNFELRAGIRANALKNWGISDLAFEGAFTAGLKWLMVDKKVQLTYLAEVYVPMFPNVVNAYHMLGLSHGIGEVVGMEYMLFHNYNFSELKSPYPTDPTYGGDLQLAININFNLTKQWAFYVEFAGMWDSATPTDYQFFYDAGITYLVKKNIQLDFFFGHGINYKHGSYGLGISWLPLKEKKTPKNS